MKTFKKALRDMQMDEQSGVMNNFDAENRVEVKPPQLTYGRDSHGPYVSIAGSEALAPVTVITNDDLAQNYTETGQLIYTLPITPTFLTNTRFKKLLQNYDKWKPENMRIHFQPMGSSVLSGGLVMLVMPDPRDSLTSTQDAISRIQRAMDYQGAVSFNVYNSEHVEFPKLPEDVAPYYVRPGGDARFEVPWTFVVLAQSTYAPDNDVPSPEHERTLGWLTLDYHCKLYDAVLPDLTDSVDEYFSFFTAQFPNNIFQVDNPTFTNGVRVIFNPANLTPALSILPTSTVYIVYVVSQPTVGGQPVVLNLYNAEIPMKKGDVYYAKAIGNVMEEGTGGFALFSNLEDAFDESNVITFAGDIGILPYTQGLLRFDCYSLI